MISTGWKRVVGSVRRTSPSPDVGLRRVGTRLAAQTVALLLVMLIVLEIVVYVITQQALLGSLQTALLDRSHPPAAFVRDVLHFGGPRPDDSQGGGPPHGRGGNPGPGGPNPDLSPSDASVAFVNRQGVIVHHDGALGAKILDRAGLAQVLRTGTPDCCTVRQYQHQDYLVYTGPLTVQGAVVGVVQSSISEHQYEDTVATLRRALLVVALLGLLGSGGVSVVLVQRALRPIRVAVQRQRDFVADAAHELRTPLAIQRTVAEVGLSGDESQNFESTVEQMLVENRHLTRLVDDLSLLARTDSQAVAIAPQPMNLSSLVADTAAELEPLAEERGMHLTASVGANIWVSGDIIRLRQLLLVLLDNALKYTPAGGAVEVQLLQAGAGRAALQVKDSGPGIDAADLPRIFDRFYRADKARSGEGSGLGLAIAKWIVDAHGGQLQAGNATPHGAVMTASLPILRRVAST